MIKKNKLTTVFFILVIVAVVLGFKKMDNAGSFEKVSGNDLYNYIAINQVLMFQANNGDGSHDPSTDGNGFYWPGGLQAKQS